MTLQVVSVLEFMGLSIIYGSLKPAMSKITAFTHAQTNRAYMVKEITGLKYTGPATCIKGEVIE